MEPPDSLPSSVQGLSIGALAQAVGIPVATLRTWESRYGYPRAERLPSGHRRFAPESVERLRLVGQLLERGHRASSIVAAERDTLWSLMALGRPAPLPSPVPLATRNAALEPWFDAVERFDVRELESHLHEGWNRAGALAFLERDLSGFLVEIGQRWRAGQLDVAREHFACAAISQFLGRQWRAMSDTATGPVAVLATLSSEYHELGLQMAAVAIALAGWRIRFLGADTPVMSVAGAAQRLPARAVAIGTSPAADPVAFRADLRDLRARLPADVALWVGGASAWEGASGIAVWPESLVALRDVAATAAGVR